MYAQPPSASAIKRALLGVVVAALMTGCPPSGDAPPFEPPDSDLPDVGRADADADVSRAECVDQDGDNYVQAMDCGGELPGGDCAPFDPQRNPGRAELCDNIDNDCDEQIDEDFSLGEACEVESLHGACRAGIYACQGGAAICEPIDRAGSDEICNGVDDDCDGSTDESFPTMGEGCDTELPGICAAGTRQCEDAGDGTVAVLCVPGVAPNPERPEVLCDGVDEDCDGETDEGNPEGGEACQSDLPGLCLQGTLTCTEAGVICQPDLAVGERGELCNTFDDDCDGSTDEDFPTLGAACSAGQGMCAREGTLICAEGGADVICDAEPGAPAEAERCDGVDDDCDGATDEAYADLGEACEVGVGACVRAGIRVCGLDGDGTTCGATPGEGGVEQCDGIDNDCDGSADEDFQALGLGQPCVDDSGQCPSPGVYVCAEGGGGLACAADPVAPVPETCDGEDNDCDGQIDEDYAELDSVCRIGVGACNNSGVWRCRADGADTECSAVAGAPSPELCDGLDNDCDGLIDDGATCPDPLTVQITLMTIAAVDDERCADLDGAAGVDNALAAAGPLLNQILALSVANGERIPLLRAPALTVDGAFPLEFVEGVAGADGAPITVAREGLNALGLAKAQIPGVALLGRQLTTETAAPSLEIISPFVYDRDPALAEWRTVHLAGAALQGPLAEGGELSLRLVEAALTGALSREAILSSYAAAAEACDGLAAEGQPLPRGCDVFGDVSYAALADALVADLDLDEDGEAESVSACLLVQTVPLTEAQVDMPQLGGLPCDDDDICLSGLICRPIVYTEDPDLGAATERRCGLPGVVGFEEGAPCSADDDCRSGLCAALSLGGQRCVDLCGSSGDCEDGAACLGVYLGTPGAVGLGGATGRVCIASEGSGRPCVEDSACEGGEVCALWFQGQVGVAGGDVSLGGRCQIPIAGDRPVGSPCGADRECANGYTCVEDGQGGRRCLQPCTGVGRCPEGSLCLEGAPITDVAWAAASYGYCTPLTPAIGSGSTCAVDLDCPGGETCRGYLLDITGEVQRYCGAGPGLFTVGQRCVLHDDCASGRCVGGLCSGTCDDNGDCGTQLGCVPDATTDPDGGGPIAGACEPASAQCLRDADCNIGGDPACAGNRCVCDQARCRIGCRYPGFCPDGLICQPDNTCVEFCKDDIEEPNDLQAQATLLSLGRGQPALYQRRRMCASSGVDWYRLNNAGQPLRLRIAPEGASERVRLEVAIIDAFGAAIPGALTEDEGGWIFELLDEQAARALAQSEIFVEIRAGGVLSPFDYLLEAELLYPDCPDSEGTPRDSYWQYDPLLHGVDQLSEGVDRWICPDDQDWYGIRVYDGDTLTVNLELLGEGGDIGMEIIGPDWPDLPDVNIFDGFDDAVEVIGAVAPGAGGGQVQITPPSRTCDLELNRCIGPGGQTLVSCDSDEDCDGSNVFVRVYGASAFDQRQYRLTASVQRPSPPQCPEDLHEISSFIGGLPAMRNLASIDPAARVLFSGVPTLAYNQEVLLEHLTLCSGDADVFSILAEPGERLTATVTQTGAPQSLRLQFIAFDLQDGSLEIYDTVTAAQASLTRSVVIEEESATFHGVQVLREQAPGVLRYALAISREPQGQIPDEGCEAPTRVALSGLNQTAIVEGTTAGARDDDVPLTCIGGAGPDRAYVVAVPGPGRVTARVDAIAEDGYDPSVYIRTACAAPASGIGCNEDDESAPNPLRRAEAQGEVLGAGDVYIIVDSFSDQTPGEFRLTVTWSPE